MARPEKFTKIATRLRQKLHEGNLGGGVLLPSRVDLMRTFDASSHTIQKAVDVLVRDGFLTTIFGGGTFVAENPPHQAVFGIALDGSAREPDKVSLFMRAIENTANELAMAYGISFKFYRQIGLDMNWAEYRRLEVDVKEHRLAGVILAQCKTRITSHGLCPWDVASVPFVNIGNCDDGVPSICPDMRSFLALAIDRLQQQGQRNVAFLDISVENHGKFDDLEKELVDRSGLFSPLHWRQRVQPAGIHACLDLLMRPGSGERPDGLVIMDDHAVKEVSSALKALGIRVPRDLLVVSLGNSGSLPQVEVPVEWIGFDTRELLERCLEIVRAKRAGTEALLQSWVEARELNLQKKAVRQIKFSEKGDI